MRLSRYVVLRQLGHGGMGSVWLAHPRELPDRYVALKMLPGIFANDPVRLARFRGEATTASRINHPGVASVLEIGEEGGVHYQIQELAPDGRTLADWIREARDARALPKGWYGDVAITFERVARALAAVHDANVIHRDIKPSNILLLPDGSPKVADFGLAKDMEGASGLTRGGSPGTLNYLSPEQVDRRFGKVGILSDVYSFGVTLYEALTLTRLHPGDEPAEVMPRILAHDVPDLRTVRPGVPRDLSTICRKCLEREQRRRYGSMAEVADDLARHLRNETIAAEDPGPWARALKWSRRNRTASAVMVTACIAVVALGWIAQAERTARQEASRSADARKRAIEQFFQLGSKLSLDLLLEEEKHLFPSHPGKVEAISGWLRQADELLATRPKLEATVRDMEAKSMPLSEEGRESDRLASPRYAEWQRQWQLVQALRHRESVRSGKEPLVLPDLDTVLGAFPAHSLHALAWARVAPLSGDAEAISDRAVVGEEPLGLALANAAVARCRAGDPTLGLEKALTLQAWALLANGEDGKVPAALDAAAEASLQFKEARQILCELERRRVEEALAESRSLFGDAEARLAQLEAAVSIRNTWRFVAEEHEHAALFLHFALIRFLRDLALFEQGARSRVEKRLQWARSLEQFGRAHPKAKVSWEATKSAIAKADGKEASAAYAGCNVSIPDDGWPGLVPIGKNPVTGLWEFYDLASAWDGNVDPQDIPIPSHEADGSIPMEKGLGIVFVLLPGGRAILGSQRQSPEGPNFDPEAEAGDHVLSVALHPFLIARHEMTQAQWSRLCTWDESLRWPSMYQKGKALGLRPVQPTHPVENIDWHMADTLLQRYGMSLPTEAQWEYACRAGTTTPWSVAFDFLVEVANLADQSFRQNSKQQVEDWNDRHMLHAPAGSFLPNAFGLHDMHGNVAEWCMDLRGSRGGERSGDGLRVRESNESNTFPKGSRVVRGGHHGAVSVNARSAFRVFNLPTVRGGILGVRAVRRIVD